MSSTDERRKNDTPEERKVRKSVRKAKKRSKGIGKGRPRRLGTNNGIGDIMGKRSESFFSKATGVTRFSESSQ